MGSYGNIPQGRIMAEKEKGKLTSFEVEIAKNGYEIRARYAPKKSLSQKKGWVPESYCEPEKTVATSKPELIKQINELLK
jgi:hypothetical protein